MSGSTAPNFGLQPGAGVRKAIYLLVAFAALSRVAAPFLPDIQLSLYEVSVAAWVAAFGLFSLVYGRMLLSR